MQVSTRTTGGRLFCDVNMPATALTSKVLLALIKAMRKRVLRLRLANATFFNRLV